MERGRTQGGWEHKGRWEGTVRRPKRNMQVLQSPPPPSPHQIVSRVLFLSPTENLPQSHTNLTTRTNPPAPSTRFLRPPIHLLPEAFPLNTSTTHLSHTFQSWPPSLLSPNPCPIPSSFYLSALPPTSPSIPPFLVLFLPKLPTPTHAPNLPSHPLYDHRSLLQSLPIFPNQSLPSF